MVEILTERTYESYKAPERRVKYKEWYRTAKCKCECNRVLLLKHIARHRESKYHKDNLPKEEKKDEEK